MSSILLNTEPISLNLMYRGRRFLTKRGKDTKESMSWEFKEQYKGDELIVTGKHETRIM